MVGDDGVSGTMMMDAGTTGRGNWLGNGAGFEAVGGEGLHCPL